MSQPDILDELRTLLQYDYVPQYVRELLVRSCAEIERLREFESNAIAEGLSQLMRGPLEAAREAQAIFLSKLPKRPIVEGRYYVEPLLLREAGENMLDARDDALVEIAREAYGSADRDPLYDAKCEWLGAAFEAFDRSVSDMPHGKKPEGP